MSRATLAFALVALLAGSAQAQQPAPGASESEREHVAPDPPRTHVDHDMSYREMVEMMGMDDRRRFASVRFPRLEWIDADESTFEWEGAVSYGGDVDKILLRTEGEHVGGETRDARTELLWDRVVSRWWSAHVGFRHDSGLGPSRDWLAVGIQGLAPGPIELSVTAYLGEGGRTAARLSAEYELLLTQRLVLEPGIELDFEDGDEDDVEFGLRLRYELRREFAPYVGVLWANNSGGGADEVSFVAGVRIWR